MRRGENLFGYMDTRPSCPYNYSCSVLYVEGSRPFISTLISEISGILNRIHN